MGRWLIALIVAFASATAWGQTTSTAPDLSALIAQAMDKQLPKSPIDFKGTLPQVIANFGDLTGVRIEADGAVYEALPWGDLTTFSAKFQGQTLRQAIDAICRKLGLQYELGQEAVLLHPLPALRRLGRRCTVDELAALDRLQSTPLEPTQASYSANDLLAAIGAKLKGTPFAIENRRFEADDKTTVNIASNATLMDGLEEIDSRTPATWYPWGNSIVVLRKPDQIRMQLSKSISTRFDGQDVSQVLLELSRQSGVMFHMEPGAVQKIPEQFRTVRLVLNDVTIQQALETLAGFTGLAYSITDDGVRIWNTGTPPASTQPAP